MSGHNHHQHGSPEGLGNNSIDMTDWTARDVSRWIAEIGHAQYCNNFKGTYLLLFPVVNETIFYNEWHKHDINGECLLKMTHRLLRDIDVESVGHRISILNAINEAQLPRSPQHDEYVPHTEATCVPIAQYQNLESSFKKCEQQIEGMGRELRRSKEEVAVAWELLAEEINRGTEIKMELIRVKRIYHRLCEDKGIETESGFLEFLQWRDEMRRDVRDAEKENGLAGDSTGHHDTTTQAQPQDDHQRPTDISRGREEFETFDERTSTPFQKASEMLECTLKALKVADNHQDWDLWVRYGNRQIRLKPDDFPVKVCRDFRKIYKPEEVGILARHKNACRGSGYAVQTDD
ncbi:hypothetical protein TWF106_000284 [Orbilia oligospora]|uniref:SAM domain-containing protein n=1 Tax=Orbilia oligospora TaxID=2813651 RepID=A0A7C8UUI8_ORBOL|nr:hypothetical protein TWF106_000284 [Orbilia oligospora]